MKLCRLLQKTEHQWKSTSLTHWALDSESCKIWSNLHLHFRHLIMCLYLPGTNASCVVWSFLTNAWGCERRPRKAETCARVTWWRLFCRALPVPSCTHLGRAALLEQLVLLCRYHLTLPLEKRALFTGELVRNKPEGTFFPRWAAYIKTRKTKRKKKDMAVKFCMMECKPAPFYKWKQGS